MLLPPLGRRDGDDIVATPSDNRRRDGEVRWKEGGEDPVGATAAVHLSSTWRLDPVWRRPWLRAMTAVVRMALCFFLCASSPLLTSTQYPFRFPVYSDLYGWALTNVSIEKMVFHGGVVLVIALFLRVVVYRTWLEPLWNWRQSYLDARKTFTRMSAVAGDTHADTAASSTHEPATVTFSVEQVKRDSGLHSLFPRDSQVHVTPCRQGSWTFVVMFLPLVWYLMAYTVDSAVRDSASWNDLFKTSEDFANTHQWQGQIFVYTVLMTLNALLLVMTLDAIAQDGNHYQSSWILRRLYINYPIVRLVLCWTAIGLIGFVGVYLRGFEMLLKEHVAWNTREDDVVGVSSLLFSNESWRMLWSGTIVALDLVWLVQDPFFPGFGSPLRSRMFGMPCDIVSIPFLPRHRLYFTSKWLGNFIALGLLLPLNVCYFVQVISYSPSDFGQVADIKTAFRVKSQDAMASELGVAFTWLEQLMTKGSLSCYFSWSWLEKLPAICILLLAGLLTVSMGVSERWRMRYTAFIGALNKADRTTLLREINAQVSKSDREALTRQQRLLELFRSRSRVDFVCSFLAIGSIVCVVLQARSIWQSNHIVSKGTTYRQPGETYSVVLLVLSIITGRQLYRRYAIKHEILVLQRQVPRLSETERWWTSPASRMMVLSFLAEFVASTIFVPPLVHGTVRLEEARYEMQSTGNHLQCPPRLIRGQDKNREMCELRYEYPIEVLNLIVFVRLYWLLRLLQAGLIRRLFADRGTILASGSSDWSTRFSSFRWVFRVSYALIPGPILLGIFVALWGGTSAAVSIFERPFPSVLDSEEHSLWLTIVTMSTVGYGDAYPLTANGRVAILCGAVVGGAVVISLLTSTFLDALAGSREEHKFLLALETMSWQKSIRGLAASLIASAWRDHVRRTASKRPRSAAVGGSAALFRRAHQFKVERKRRRPKGTHETMQAHQVDAVIKWRTSRIDHWLQSRRARCDHTVASLEKDMNALEQSLRELL